MLRAWFEKRMRARDTGDVGELMSPALSESTGMDCPRCGAKLRATTNADITVEWCDACHGVYLDSEEPDRIMAWRRKLRGRNRRDMAKAAIQTAVEYVAEIAFGGLLGRGLWR